MAHTIKVSGISDELFAHVERRWRGRHFSDRSEYVRDLIRRDAFGESAPSPTLAQGIRELFGGLHDDTARGVLSEETIAEDVRTVLTEVRRGRKVTAVTDP